MATNGAKIMQCSKHLTRHVCTAAFVSLILPTGAHAEDWLTFGKTAQRQGYNGQETVLNGQTVPGLHQLWQFPMNGPILTQPLLASGILLDDGTGTGNTVPVDLVYVADVTGLTAAFDAGGSGMRWATQLPAPQTFCGAAPNGASGVMGTPVIDKPNNRMWLVPGDGTLWALALDTGSLLPGYPVQIIVQGTPNGDTFDFGALTYVNGSVYVPTAGLCDIPPYHGQLIKVTVGNDGTSAPKVAARWYPTGVAGPDGGGIWSFGGASVEADNSAIYIATGNSLAAPENGGYADQVVMLDPNLQLMAANAPKLTGEDTDFGATPVLYQPANCPPQMAVMNKTGELFIYNRDAASLASGPMQRIAVTQDVAPAGDFIGLPAYDPVSQQLYLGNPKDDQSGTYPHGLLAFGVANDCTLSLQWQQTIGTNATPGSDNPMIPPMVANGVIYYSTGNASSVFAYDSAGNYLWDSGRQLTGGVLISPTIVNGLLLVAGYGGKLTAFGP